jgi:NAD(P)-dependent dehydrogenase (short-subunit alcohol dehydrogenase family)
VTLSGLIDTALDRSIALGYGKVGLELRRRLPGWPADPPRMDGRVVIVTGAASGLGLAASERFAALGAAVKPVGRTVARAQEAAAQISRTVPGADLEPLACDVSSLSEVRAFAARFAAEHDRLDVLVNNAGVMPEERSQSADGHELMFATHVLAPFALTSLLGGLLERSAPSRVINVSSGGMYGQRLPEDDLESAHTKYGSKKLYARTKREEVAISEAWAERLRDSGVVVHSMHPGWVDTEGVRQWLPVFRIATRAIIRDPAQGADTIVWLGASPDALERTGCFWADRRPRPTHYSAGAPDHTAQARQKLWDYCQAEFERGAPAGP